jgi:hypothetical protein
VNVTVAHGHAEHHCLASLWYQSEPDSLLVLLMKGEALLFGKPSAKPEPHIIEIDVATLSRRVCDRHCRLWFVRGAYVLYNLSRHRKATLLARQVKDREPMASDVKVETADKQTVLLCLRPVEVEALVDLSQDCLFLVEPEAPNGQILVRFLPQEQEGEYVLDPQPCKVLEITK